MENNKREEAALNDELLDKVSGGSDNYDLCEWNPGLNKVHEWVDWVDNKGVTRKRCKWCEIWQY